MIGSGCETRDGRSGHQKQSACREHLIHVRAELGVLRRRAVSCDANSVGRRLPLARAARRLRVVHSGEIMDRF